MRTLYAVLVIAVVAGCASVQPAKVLTGDTCYRCHRSIGEPKLAAEIVDRTDQVMTSYPFRTSACMAKYLKQNPPTSTSVLFVTDYKTGRMFGVESAWFVPTTLTSPDGKKSEKDYTVFRSRDEALEFGKDAQLRRWADVLSEVVPD